MGSLFRSSPPTAEPTITTWEQLVGHTFTYEEGIYSTVVRLLKADDGLVQVETTRHVPAGPSTSSVFVDSDGILRKCPDYSDRYNGARCCQFLTMNLRTPGHLIQPVMYPSPLRVKGKSKWEGKPVWLVDYDLMGRPGQIIYDQATGIKLAQTGLGKLTKSSLK